MATVTKLDEDFHVGPQITPGDVAELAEQGFGFIINNRPDVEEDGQPTGADIHEAAKEAGLGYAHVPVERGISPAEVEAEADALVEAGDAKVFAFCRSGTRSALLWALAQRADGRDTDELRAKAEAAGYSLDPIQHLL